MEKKINKEEILKQIKELQEKSKADTLELERIREERLKEESGLAESNSEENIENKVQEKSKTEEEIETKKSDNKDNKTEAEKMGVPFMVINDMKQQLADLGWSLEDINKMTPEEAWNNIKNQKTKEKKPEESKAVDPKITETVKNALGDREKELGRELTSEEKRQLILDSFLKGKNETQEAKLGKFSRWWKNLDNSRMGKAVKAGIGAGILTTSTLVLGNFADIAPSLSSSGWRVLTRVVSTTGMNMALTSNLTKKIFGVREKNEDEKVEVGKLKQAFQKYGKYAFLVGGVGASFILSGGALMPAFMALAGGTQRIIFNALFDENIKKYEEKMKSLSQKIQIERLEGGFDIEKFSNNLGKIGTEYDLITKKLNSLKRWKGIINVALAFEIGLGTMAVMSHPTDLEAQIQKTESKGNLEEILKNKNANQETERIKEMVETKHKGIDQEVAKLKESLDQKFKLEEIKTATVHAGGSYESSFIQQIEKTPGLAQKLGYEGKLDDIKALHEFAGREAHVIALKNGIVDNEGNEIWVAEKDKIAPVIKVENGEISIEVKKVEDGGIIETYHQGGKFGGEKMNEYEYEHDKPIFNPEEFSQKIKPIGFEDQLQKSIDESLLNGNESEYIEKDISQELSKGGQNNDLTEKIIQENYGQQKNPYQEIPRNFFTTEELGEINKINHYNLDKIFPGVKGQDTWDYIKNNKDLSAKTMWQQDINEVNDKYKPLVSYLQKLVKETGLEPKGETRLTSAETNLEFINRALMKAATTNKLDQIKL